MTKRITVILLVFASVSIALFYFARKSNQHSKSQSQSNLLVVGTNAEFEPFSFIENDTIVGFDIDVAKEVAKRLGKKMELVNMSYDALIPEIQLGSIHMIAAGMTPSPERAKRVFFTKPHFAGDPLMIIQPDSATPLATTQQLKNKSVVVNQGYTADQFVTQLPEIGEIIRISSPLIADGILTLISGTTDAYIASYNSIKPYLDKNPNHGLRTTPIAGTQESSALGVSKKFPDLYSAIENSIAQMHTDGTILKLIQKWKLND